MGIITKLYDGDNSSYKELIKEYRQNVIKYICELKIAVSKLQEYSFYFDSDNKAKYKNPKLCSCAPEIIEIDENKFINITPELLSNYKKMIKKQNENIELANKKLHFEQHYCKKQEKKIKEFDKLISDGKNSALEALYFIKNIEWLLEKFPNGKYQDILGLCKVAKIEEEDGIREQDYSLNPGRYVGVVIEDDGMTEEEFQNTIKYLNEEVKELNINSNKLLNEINKNVDEIFK